MLYRVSSNNSQKSRLVGSWAQHAAEVQGRAGKGSRGADLRPCSRQVHRVSLVACWLGASPLDITGLISSMNTSQSSYCQKLYTACTSAPSQWGKLACGGKGAGGVHQHST